jgi:hypothetical protein
VIRFDLLQSLAAAGVHAARTKLVEDVVVPDAQFRGAPLRDGIELVLGQCAGGKQPTL